MDLTTIPGVELCQTGTWFASTGEHTFTTEDWHAVVAAASDPAFRAPQVYLGHDHISWGDGGPSVGHISHLRVSDDGINLIGDLELLPAIAELAPVVWPSRSIEGLFSVTSSTGNQYRMILTGLALLGEQLPALETLNDLLDLAGVTAATDTTPFTLTLGGQPTMTTDTQTIAAATNVENVRRAWWDRTDDLRAGIWAYSWVRSIYAGDEQYLVVETDEADEDTGVYLFQVPWTETDGAVSFGDPVPVREAFVPADDISAEDAAELGAPGAVQLARFTPSLQTAAESGLLEAHEDHSTPEGSNMSDTATVAATGETTETAPVAVAAGVTQIDANILAELRAGAAAGAEARAELAAIRHTQILEGAVAAGRIAPASRAQFAALLTADETNTVALIESLAPGAPTVELGAATNPEASNDDALYTSLFGSEA